MILEEKEIVAINNVSSIEQWNYTELLCFFLLRYFRKNFLWKNIEKDLVLSDLIITHYNYWGGQLCDLKLEIWFCNSQIKSSIYIESKGYFSADTDKKRSLSVEDSVKQFIKHKQDIFFWDMYMVFIPWQNNLVNVEFVEQVSQSKDLYFPRYYFQVSQDILEHDNVIEVMDFLKGKISAKKTLFTVPMIEKIQKELEQHSTFIELAQKISDMLCIQILKSRNHYLRDIGFEEEIYLKCYDQIEIDELTSLELLNNIGMMFEPNWQNIDSWKENIQKFLKEYLLRKYGYKKYPDISEMIEKRENDVGSCVIGDIIGYTYKTNWDFDDHIIQSVSGLSHYRPFTTTFLVDNMQRKGLIYKYCKEKNFLIKYQNDIYILLQKNA